MGKIIVIAQAALPLFVLVAWKALTANPEDASNQAACQISISDIFILTSVLALEIAAFWQKDVLLTCVFLSVSICTVALLWKRLLLRRVLLVAMTGSMVLS